MGIVAKQSMGSTVIGEGSGDLILPEAEMDQLFVELDARVPLAMLLADALVAAAVVLEAAAVHQVLSLRNHAQIDPAVVQAIA
jgi:hypothetical protein